MARPVTIFSGQWADLPLDVLAPKLKTMGFDGIELACWGDHFDVEKAISEPDYCDKKRAQLEKHGLKCWAISAHLQGQGVLDVIDERHKSILDASLWGDGNPAGVNARCADFLKKAARAAKKFGVSVVNGFTGSSIWPYLYSFPPVPQQWIDNGFKLLAERFNPILDVFGECGVKFALEVHPTEIAFDTYSAEMALDVLKRRPEFGFNFDPSHLLWQGVDPAKFIYRFKDRIYHTHMKDVALQMDGLAGILASHINFGDPRRGWEFRSIGHGDVNFEEIIRALNNIGYNGPLSIEWEDMGMDRERGAKESLDNVRKMDFSPSTLVFDDAFNKDSQAK